MKNIDEFTPTMLYTQARTEPYAIITIVFDNDKDPIDFKSRFIDNSGLELKMGKTERNAYLLNFIFPKEDNYSLGLETAESENAVYKKLISRNISITCGFKMPDGKIAALPNPYVLDNKVNLN